MSECPEVLRQQVILHGVKGVLQHLLTAAGERKAATAAAMTYEADEMDDARYRESVRDCEILTQACQEYGICTE